MDEDSLFKFYKGDGFTDHIDIRVRAFLKPLGEGDNILILGSNSDIIEKIAKEKKLNYVVFCLDELRNKNNTTEKILEDFLTFSKKSGTDQFDAVVDIGFSQFFQKSRMKSFYTMVSRLSKHNTRIYSLIISNQSQYCKEHCPKRLWTYIDDQFVKFFKKEEIRSFILKKFKINQYKHIEFPQSEKAYHELESTHKLMKLN